MAKTKTAPAEGKKNTAILPDGLGDQLAKAIALVEGKKHEEAAKALEALAKAATERGLYGLERTVRTYQSLLPAKAAKSKGDEHPEMDIQVLLNKRDPGALAAVDKALKAHPGSAQLHYLKAAALAQKGEAEPAAEALKKALELNADMLYVYQLEPDFEPMRRQAAFAAFERM
jgi:tetratricopeptide (TPR) repeat protein